MKCTTIFMAAGPEIGKGAAYQSDHRPSPPPPPPAEAAAYVEVLPPMSDSDIDKCLERMSTREQRPFCILHLDGNCNYFQRAEMNIFVSAGLTGWLATSHLLKREYQQTAEFAWKRVAGKARNSEGRLEMSYTQRWLPWLKSSQAVFISWQTHSNLEKYLD